MINCAIYPRKSRANDNSQSMEQQVDDCTRYIRNHYKDANIYVYGEDYGITGHSIVKRKDFQRMMSDIKKGIIDIVVIMRYDRIARNMRDFCNIFYEIESNGGSLVSVSQQIDTSTPYGKNFMYQMAAMAELEWALTSERYKDMHRYKISHGYAYTAKLPRFGFKLDAESGAGKKVVHDKEEETRDIFDHLLKVKSKNETVRYVREKYDKDFTRRMLDSMIASDLYIGKVRDNSQFCEPYFTKEYMDSVRSINCIKKTPTGNCYLFTGLVKCPLCGRMLSANINAKNKKLYVYYRCPGSVQNRHKHYAVPESRIETALVNNLKEYLDSYNSTLINISVDEKKAAEQQIKSIKDTMKRIDHLFELGRISIDEYDNKISFYSGQLSELNTKLCHKKTKANDVIETDWKSMYHALNRDKQQYFWQSIINEIRTDENGNVLFIMFK